MIKILLSAKRCNSGATAIEYALIAGIISIAVVAGATSIGVNFGLIFTGVLAAF